MKVFVLLLIGWIVFGNSLVAQVGDPPAPPDSILRAAEASYYGGGYVHVIDLLQPSGGRPRSPKANYYLGSSFAALNDPQNAIRYLRMAVDSAGREIPFRFQLAKSLLASGAASEARAEYRAILAQDSAYLPALFNLGALCFDDRDFASAAALFSGVIRLNARDYLGYYNLAASLVNLGKPDSALQFLRAGMALNRRYVPCLSLLASLYYKRKEYDDAGRLYGMILARDTASADFWARKGYCMEKIGAHREALACFLSASKFDTANSTYPARVGQACFELNKFDSAALFYLRAASLEEEGPVLYLNAGLAYARMDSMAKALEAFDLSYRASHVERLGFLYGQIAGVYYKQKRYRRAGDSYQKALRYDPGNKRAWFFLAHCREEMHDYRGAASSYRRFLDLARGDPAQDDLTPYARKRLKELSGP